KSTTGGIGINAWQNIPTGFEVLGVGAIAINPNNTNEMFIGTGETYSYGTNSMGISTRTERGSYGIGILKSDDGGITWEKSLDWSYVENRGVWEILYNPLDTNILYAATTEGVYKTTDGGDNWENVMAVKMIMDMEMDRTSGEIIYAAAGNLVSEDKGIYKSTDAGATWELLTTGLPVYTHDGRITITASETNYNKLWAIIGNALSTVGVYYSNNAGDSWTLIDNANIVSYQGWFAKGLLINANDEDEILAGGVELFKSTDGGNSFTQITTYTGPDSYVHPDHHGLISNPLDPEKVYDINDGGLFRSNDFGETWYSCNDGYVTSQFYIGSVSSQTNDVGLGGLQDNFTQRYDGTNYWLAVIGGDGTYNAINYEDDQIQYGAYQYLGILKSYDQGYNFYESMSTGSSNAFLAPYIMSESDPEIIYAGKNGLAKTTNGGSIWANVGSSNVDGSNPIIAIGVAPTDPEVVYFATAPVSNNADVFVSTDGGLTKANITGSLPDRYPRDIAVSRKDPNEVYIVYAGFGGGHVFKSTNAGTDWEDISTTLPDIPFHTIFIDMIDDSILYAGSDITLFTSTDKGVTWDVYNDGLPEAAMIFDIQASPSDSTLFVYTHGRGVYTAKALTDIEVIDTIDTIEITIIDFLDGIHAFPNIVDDLLTISSEQDIPDAVLSVFDMQGSLVHYTRFFADRKKEIDCSRFATGNYIIKIHSGQKVFTGKIFKI
ncbi:MAG: T9SS type A sorting domain-containing protein, partial [Chitinophagales bacterium]